MRVNPGAARPLALALATLILAALGLSCAVPRPADRYALVYGVANYTDPDVNDLNYTDDDATAMAAALAAGGWTVSHLRVDAPVTKAAILADIEELRASLGRDSSFLLYFSGHGIGGYPDGSTYIGPADLSIVAGSLVLGTAISSAELGAWLASLDCRNKILILDTCFSGGFVAEGDTLDTAPDSYGPLDGGTVPFFPSGAVGKLGELLARNAAAAGDDSLVAISAAGSEELSWEIGAFGHGIFTYYLLSAFDQADADGDRIVTTLEAYGYAARKIEAGWNSDYWNQDIGPPYDGVMEDYYPHVSGGSRDIALYDLR